MATKFYFHRGTTSVGGTLPGAGASVSATTPSQIAPGGDTNRTMDTTISAIAQTTNTLTCLANTSAQPSLILRFVSPLLAAQTIAIQDVNIDLSGFESNTNSNFSAAGVVVSWRPSDGSKQTLLDNVSGAGLAVPFFSTTQITGTKVATNASVTIADGDVLVVEIWRTSVVQGMATAYTNTVAYDGTTETSTTNEAAFLNFIDTVSFSSGATELSPSPRPLPFQAQGRNL